jgi:hypothetical protein
MNLHNRIARLLSTAQPAARRQRVVGEMMDCTDWDLERILEAVTERSSPAGRMILADIDAQIAQYWREDDDRSPHGYVLWLCDLHDGHGLLPPSVPDAVLAGFLDGTARRLARMPSNWQDTPNCHPPCVLPCYRCADCRALLPCETPDGWPSTLWAECPVCGSPAIERQDWAQPHGIFVPV